MLSLTDAFRDGDVRSGLNVGATLGKSISRPSLAGGTDCETPWGVGSVAHLSPPWLLTSPDHGEATAGPDMLRRRWSSGRYCSKAQSGR